MQQVYIFPLSYFDSSIKNGQISEQLRNAIVVPVHKKDVTNDPNNYRPILLTCTCCRVMEWIINDNILSYLLQNLVALSWHIMTKYTRREPREQCSLTRRKSVSSRHAPIKVQMLLCCRSFIWISNIHRHVLNILDWRRPITTANKWWWWWWWWWCHRPLAQSHPRKMTAGSD